MQPAGPCLGAVRVVCILSTVLLAEAGSRRSWQSAPKKWRASTLAAKEAAPRRLIVTKHRKLALWFVSQALYALQGGWAGDGWPLETPALTPACVPPPMRALAVLLLLPALAGGFGRRVMGPVSATQLARSPPAAALPLRLRSSHR